MIIYVDVDNTICGTTGMDYENAIPWMDKIAKINQLFDEGHEIIYWTARGSGSGRDLFDLTRNQLIKWGVKYHKFMVGKPVYDLFIDDKTINIIDEKLTTCVKTKKS